MFSIPELIARQLSLSSLSQAENTIRLLDDGCTVPFISRYRKEATGGLDEIAVERIRELYGKYTELEKRKTTVLQTIEEQGKLTPQLKAAIADCADMAVLEDLYLPYKPKRRTRGTIAREKGLEPLARMIMGQSVAGDLRTVAEQFVKGDVVPDADAALAGASDIIAEWVSESAAARDSVRRTFASNGIIVSKIAKGADTNKEESAKFSDYYDWSEPLRRCASHRLMAMARGEKAGVLRLSLGLDAAQEESLSGRLNRIFVRREAKNREAIDFVCRAVADGYKRLVKPSIETELLGVAKERADEEAIKVFAENLRQLLLAAPLGQKNILAVDPGFRTGCKVVCLDRQGNLLHNETIYPHAPQSKRAEAGEALRRMVRQYGVEAIAVGNGTAGRETEQLVRDLRLDMTDGSGPVPVYMVSEDGASVYSASATAREEFPDYDVTVRGSVSIGRRLMDPLAELVKIDPKSIGVGQYQHDVDQTKLKRSLDTVVESCVNRVGVSLNTASKHLLAYVSGLGPVLAGNIVEYRAANGAFRSRKELLKVPRLGTKSFEQSAGFLRIEGAANPLDDTAVHPESYPIVEKMAADLGVTVGELVKNESLRQKINLNHYVTKGVGIQTLTQIMSEFSKEGRDPRTENLNFQFAEGINSINDLQEGMVLPGIVTNITNFGVFVDVGAKQDGLVHISQLANKFVQNPADVVSLNQEVKVKVMEVDMGRKRISLSMKALLNEE
ncbi:MAG: RNA-binding transcriptional accessory protein [Rikenellaceae bacterium]|nr:RNA-binding transcriptional accessory protein [Rikenellaceae bacterium]MCC8063312.1 RNA-binding transcriptional accessory protein [Rikenellaceae bacterium]